MRDLNTSTRPGAGQIAVLGGSAEARDLVERLGDSARLWLPARDRVTGQSASDAGRSPDTRFRAWAADASAIINAPHPCDVASLRLGAATAQMMGVPFVTLSRPAWRPTRRDTWISVRAVADAARHIPAGARVLVTLGRPVLPELCALRHAHAFVRQLTRHDHVFPLPHGRFLFGAAPFTTASEIAVMRKYRIDAVLTRNAGGTGGWPKVAAARALGIPVYMIAREAVQTGCVVTSVEEALRWGRARTWSDV